MGGRLRFPIGSSIVSALVLSTSVLSGAEEAPAPPTPTAAPDQEVQPEQQAELWAGHQLFLGSRTVPILGELETRSEIYVLAQVEQSGGEIRLQQRLCKMEVARFAGIRVSFLPEGVPKMPSTRIVFQKKGADRFEAIPWTTSWTTEDVDGDGKPGATVLVEAPICGGTVLVGSTSRSIARGSTAGGGFEGELRVSVAQRILETSKGCISLAAHDSENRMLGTFRYVPVAADATCESLQAAGWPAQATSPKEVDRQEEQRRPRPKPLRR